MRQRRRPYREPDEGEDAISDNLVAVNERLDELTQQLERIAQAKVGKPARASRTDEHVADHVAEALARLDRRLDEVVHEGRRAVLERRTDVAPPPPPSPPPQPAPAAAPSQGHVSWAAQISARQRALEGNAARKAASIAPAAAAAVAAQPSDAAIQNPVAVEETLTAPIQVPAAPLQAPVEDFQMASVAPAIREPGPDLAAVEQQLRQINSQISSLQQPYEDGLATLRNDLAEIGRTLHEAMPRHAIEALEADVRALAERLDRTRQAGADGTALATLEHGLEEVRDALRGLTPAESLVGFEDAVRGLSDKIDQLAASTQAGQDPLALKQLEQAVVSLRGVVSNVASDGALEQLSAEVRTLGHQFERAVTESSADALAKLETRISTLMESGRAMPPELEGSIRALSERLDRMQLSQGDQLALVALEDRIAKLSEKLDASDARLRHLDAIERGLADLLVYLEEMRNGAPRGLRAPADAPQPVPQKPAESTAVSLLDRIPPAPEPAASVAQAPVAQAPVAQAPVAQAPVAQAPTSQAALPPSPTLPPSSSPAPSSPAPVASQPAAEVMPPPPPAKPMSRGQGHAPIAPDLAPDTPLEPGSGVPSAKPGSPAARIAASEAVLGNTKRTAAESGGKAAALAAARNAAKAAYLDTPVSASQTLRQRKGGWLRWPARKPRQAEPAPPIEPALAVEDSATDQPLSRGRRMLRLLKTLLIAASVAVIVVGAAQTAFELLWSGDSAAPPVSQTPKQPAPPAQPLRPMPAPEGALPAAPGAEPGTTGQIQFPAVPAPSPSVEVPTNPTPGVGSFLDPSTVVAPPPRSDITGSISRQPIPPRPPVSKHPRTANESSPPSISPTLQAAADSKNPAAEYELGARYAEGRGVAQNMSEAIRWFERAADAGFAPAQFRLASLNEKGNGLKKDLQTARRLYIAAATKGHAKAMHNLAVLYAEGVDGKPDYKVAAQWFHKAAGYGVTDSQYNLAILYARGIGVQANLAESYKWFALAAASGDADAARKRDEVGARLDRQSLTAARLAVQTFVPEREPEEASSLKAPPGGWDHAPAAPAKARRRNPA